MNVETRLRAALESRAATASPNPAALAGIRARSDRRRWSVRLQVGFAAAAVAGVAVGAFALTGDQARRPVPPTTGETTIPSPSPSASTSATAAPASPALGRNEFVAVLRDGRLAVVSASDGRVLRTVLAGAVTPRDGGATPVDQPVEIVLAPDRRTAYLASRTPSGTCPAGEGTIDRVDLGTGERTRIGTGYSPDVSPDGTKLAYVTGCDDETIVVRDLRTGAEQRITHAVQGPGPQGGFYGPWMLDRAVWQADGTRLWVVLHWEDLTDLRVLDPATDRTTHDAQAVDTRYAAFALDRHGTGLVYLHLCCFNRETGNAIVTRSADGTERVLVQASSADRLGMPEAGPDGDLLYVRAGRLYRIGPDGGTPTDLGASTALARDW